MKKQKLKIIYIADELTDQDGLAQSFVESKVCTPQGLLSIKDVDYIFYSLQNGKSHSINIIDIPNIIRGANVVFFDYGGFDVCGQDNYRLIDHYSRFFIKLIMETPSIEWWCTSALPKNYFDEEEIEELKKLGVKFAWS